MATFPVVVEDGPVVGFGEFGEVIPEDIGNEEALPPYVEREDDKPPRAGPCERLASSDGKALALRLEPEAPRPRGFPGARPDMMTYVEYPKR